MIPPKKHLLKHQPVSTQIALMDGNTFCTSLTPRLFSIDLSIVEHKVFFNEVSGCGLVGVAQVSRTAMASQEVLHVHEITCA